MSRGFVQYRILKPKTAKGFLCSYRPTLVGPTLLEVAPFHSGVKHYCGNVHWSLVQFAVIIVQLLLTQVDARHEVVLGRQQRAIHIAASLRDQVLGPQPLKLTEQSLKGREHLPDGTEFITSGSLQQLRCILEWLRDLVILRNHRPFIATELIADNRRRASSDSPSALLRPADAAVPAVLLSLNELVDGRTQVQCSCNAIVKGVPSRYHTLHDLIHFLLAPR